MIKSALVTGAGKRLGKAMALYLAEQGYDVAVHYNSSASDAEAVVDEITGMGRRAVALGADLLDWDATEALVPAAVGALGPLGVLVNSASIFEYDTIQSATRDSWERHMNSNLRAPLQLTQAFAAQAPDPIPDDIWGEPTAQALIVNLVDQRVRKLTPEFMTYTLAKMGLWAMTRTTAQALAPRVRVNAIGPGPTMQGARQSSEHFSKQRAATILQRGADSSGMCRALGYFVTEPSVTGQLICVDGGQHLAWETPDVLGVE